MHYLMFNNQISGVMSEKWCEIRVLKDGRTDWPFVYAKVAGKVPGFIGGMTSDFRTDDRGITIVKWCGGDYLKELYISGRTFEGPFESGRSYTISYWV